MRLITDLYPVIWDEWIQFKHNFIKITLSTLISPLLYMIAFGLGIGGSNASFGSSYMKFLLPGIIALTTMNGGYKAISVKLITNRVYDKTFEQYLIAPISLASFCLGKSLAGALRAMYAGSLVLLVGILFGIDIYIDGVFLGVMFLNGLTFSALGLLGALLSKSHADMNRFGTFVILPMSFLCGTFFKTEYLPRGIRQFISVLPLTHSSSMLRSVAVYEGISLSSLLIVIAYCLLFLGLSYEVCHRAST